MQLELTLCFDVPAAYYDTPAIINEKIGNNVPVFQLSQQIPLPAFNYTTGAGGAAPESVRPPLALS